MKTLILLSLLLVGCGKTLMPDELPEPGMVWTPFPGITIYSTPHPQMYEVAIRCNAALDFDTFKISEEVLEPCEIKDFEGEVFFILTPVQIQELKEYWVTYKRTRRK